MPKLTVYETQYWVVSHRRDSRYPGYLMVSSREEVSDISSLSDCALVELGRVLSRMEGLLKSVYSPYKVITAKLGFSPGFSCHFHMLPVSRDLIQEVTEHPEYSNEPDGTDTFLFANRTYCERSLTEYEYETIETAVNTLREQQLTRPAI